MRTNDEIIEIIFKLKEEKNLSLSELARRLNMAKSGLSRYFNKTRQFPLNRVNEFAKVLGTTPEYILGFELSEKTPEFSKEDDNPIQKELEELISKLDSQVYHAYDDEDKELLIEALRHAVKLSKRMTKKEIESHTD